MAKSINNVTLLGHVGAAIEVQTTRGGTPVANVSLATNERRRSGDAWQDHTEWHALVFFGRLAELVRDYVNKGTRIHVTGRLSTRSWEDQKTGVKRYKTEIIADDLVLLGDSSVSRQAHDDYSQGEPGEQYAGAY